MSKRMLDWLVPAATVLLLVVVWHVADLVFEFERFILPSPLEVWQGFLDTRDTMLGHTWTTLSETLLGYGLATVVGIPLAIAIVYSPLLERSVYPLLVGLQSVPKIAIAPIVVIWFGFGIEAKVVVVFLVCFFPIVIATATGLGSTPRQYVDMIRSFEASDWNVFRRVRFPAALPHIFVGLKIAIALAIIGAVIGEFVGANQGLGFLISTSRGNVRTDVAFAAIIVLGVMSIVLYYLLVLLERWLVPWSEERVQPM